MVIIDTDVLIQCLKNEKKHLSEVTGLLESQAAVITPVQVSEVYAHALSEELPMISAFFDLFRVANFTRKTAEVAGEFMQQYKRYYPELTISDCLVGATASTSDYEIYTLHPKHFPMTEVALYSKTIEVMTLSTRAQLQNYHD